MDATDPHAAFFELQWQQGGLGDYFVRATDDILPDALLERVKEELLIFEKHEREERAKSVQGGTVSGIHWLRVPCFMM